MHTCIAILFNCKQFSLEYAECIHSELYTTWFSIHGLKVIRD